MSFISFLNFLMIILLQTYARSENSTRNNRKLSILARKTCYKGWKLEYRGYLMAGYYGHSAGSKFTCIDTNPDTLHGGHASMDGYLFYLVEAQCGSLKCPPYVNGRVLVCVVCSKE